MGNLYHPGKVLISKMFFYHRVYLNGEQILLDNECIENLDKILDELHPSNYFDIYNKSSQSIINGNLFSQKDIIKIYANILPKDSQLLNIDELERANVSHNESIFDIFPIYNFFSPSSFTKINKVPFSHQNLDFKLINENKKYKTLEYHPKKLEKDYYSIFILDTENGGYNRLFIHEFLNYLFDVSEDDNYRLILGENKDKTEDNFGIKYISSKKGDFAFYCFDKYNLDKFKSIEGLINYFKSIEKNSINLILFNMYEVESEPVLEINESDKDEMFFACPSISFNMLKCYILDTQYKYMNALETCMKNKEPNEKLFKEIILLMAKSDELLRSKLTSCYFNYDSIFSEKKIWIFFLNIISL